MRTFARQLRDARLRKGFKSAEAFAEHIGVHPHTYRKYERDPKSSNSAEPDFFMLTRICEHLDVTPNDLLTEAGKRPFQQPTSGKSSKERETAKI